MENTNEVLSQYSSFIGAALNGVQDVEIPVDTVAGKLPKKSNVKKAAAENAEIAALRAENAALKARAANQTSSPVNTPMPVQVKAAHKNLDAGLQVKDSTFPQIKVHPSNTDTKGRIWGRCVRLYPDTMADTTPENAKWTGAGLTLAQIKLARSPAGQYVLENYDDPTLDARQVDKNGDKIGTKAANQKSVPPIIEI